MNEDFQLTSLGTAVNAEGAAVRSFDRELLEYTRGSHNLFIDSNYVDEVMVIYKPELSDPFPDGMSESDVLREIYAGAHALAMGGEVRWGD